MDERGGDPALVAGRARLGDGRLAFTWIWDGDSRRTLIEIDFDETDGVTTVSFTHSGLWDEEAVRSHEGGWGRVLDNLGRTLEAPRSD